MKRFNRHGLIALIVSSLVLLGVFQVFWIKKVYDEQLLHLKKDLDQTFRAVVTGMQDSIIQLNLGDFPKTVPNVLPSPPSRISSEQVRINAQKSPVQDIQSIRIIKKSGNSLDTTRSNREISFVQKDGIKITIASDSLNGSDIAKMVGRIYMSQLRPYDSLRKIRHMMRFDAHRGDSFSRRRAPEIHFATDTAAAQIVFKKSFRTETLKKDSNIFIKLNLDSLRLDDIAAHYTVALVSQKIDLPFHIRRLHQSQLPPPQYVGLTTQPVFAGMPRFNVYIAQFPEYQAFIFRQTAPQIFFSLLLFGLTTLAFGLVYRSLRQQERLTALKNDFISNITHELKTPIATVSVAIEALQNFNALQKPELTKEYLDISKNELSRLSMLVDKVLKLSVFEQKEPELNKETLDLAALVAQILDSMRLQFEKLGVKIALDTEGVEHTFVEADKTHLTSVVYNLLDNATKYNGKNIHIHFSNDAQMLKMDIQDDGCGIASEYQGKIFDKFFRVPKGDVHNVKGYGLGLSYVASILNQHSGRIEVESALEKGSTFSVFLPKKMY